MVHDQSQLTTPPSRNSAGKPGAPAPRQAVAGLMPPQLGEAMIREVWPSVLAYAPRLSRAAAFLMQTVILAPVGWFILGLGVFPIAVGIADFTMLVLPPGWLLLIPPFRRKFGRYYQVCRRYTLTNQRLMIRKGLRPTARQEVALSAIDDVRVVPESLDAFYRAGDLEVLSGGQVVLKLPGVPEPESFRQSILNAVRAWVPEKAKGPWVPANAPLKT
jgi:hypothetical protein